MVLDMVVEQSLSILSPKTWTTEPFLWDMWNQCTTKNYTLGVLYFIIVTTIIIVVDDSVFLSPSFKQDQPQRPKKG